MDATDNRPIGETREQSVTDVLKSVSDEVRMLSDMAADIQNLIGNLLVAGAFDGSQSVYQLQSIDKLCQNLGAVADFVENIAKKTSADWKVEVTGASNAVKLTEVGNRLGGRSPRNNESAGEFEDFDDWSLAG
jgi:hypothetical protein